MNNKNKKLMKYIGVLSLSVILCLCVNIGFANAQIVSSQPLHLVSSQPLAKTKSGLTIDKGTRLAQALKTVGNHFDVVFLYRNDIVKNKQVTRTLSLGDNLRRALSKMLEGHPLRAKKVSRKTYGIFPKTVDNHSINFHPLINIQPKQSLKLMEVQATVSGTVTNARTGKPMVGVNILVVGTNIGTITDSEGHYSLDVPSLQDTLRFSFIGYQTQIVPIDGRTTVNVVMKRKTIVGGQLVVTGFQKRTKKSIAGAVSTVSSKDIKNVPTSGSTVNMLTGKIPGLRVRQTGGEPGDYSTSFNIRGFGDPLVVIDGVPGGSLKRLNPNAIASITVIKDATGAQYGVRAANGVIIVTTKKGQQGEVSINVQSSYGWSMALGQPNPMNAYQYTSVLDAALINAGRPPRFSKETVMKYKKGLLPSTNWVEVTMRQFTPHYKEFISASGGSEKINYYLSLGYIHQAGRYESGDLYHRRINFRSNITAHLTDNLKATFMIWGHSDHHVKPGKDNARINSGVYKNLPTIPVYANQTKPFYSLTDNGDNTVAITTAEISGYTHNKHRKLTGVLKLDYKIPGVQGLSVRGFYSYSGTYENTKVWHPVYILYTYDEATETYIEHPQRFPTTLSRDFDQTNQTNIHLSVHYERLFAEKHKVKGFLLYSQLTRNFSNFNGSRRFVLDIVDQLPAGKTVNQQITSDIQVPYGDIGFVGSLTYSYETKFSVTGKFRYDGSSKFAEGHKWGFFPSIAASWNLSSESFIEDNPNLNFINNLRLRASYGVVGDDRAANFQYLTGFTYPGPSYVFGGTIVSGFAPLGLANQNLTWFTSKILNIGLDVGLWNDQLTFSINAFRRKRTGLLATLNLSLPSSVGAELPQQNLNSDLNHGLEFQISTTQHFGPSASLSISGNVAYTRHKRLHVEHSVAGNSYLNWRNSTDHRWSDIAWGYKVIGRFQSKKQIKNYPVQDGRGNTTLLPGDFIYEDFNGDGVINSLDIQPIGRENTFPSITFGLNINSSWKNWNFNLRFTGAAMTNISWRSAQWLFVLPFSFGKDSGIAKFTNRWHHKNIFDRTSPWVPGHFPTNHGVYNQSHANYYPSTWWLQNMNYARLKSASISYTITPNNNGPLKSIRIFANGYNLITISHLRNLDPERVTVYAYPVQRKFNLGVDIGF